MICINRGNKMSWQNDYDFEDLGAEGEGIVTTYYCCKCGTLSENYIPENGLNNSIYNKGE